ncbi:MAG: dihydroorotate dehydrogenase [Alteromonas macleodii]|jgi:dihydroorotate dehydrogenase
MNIFEGIGLRILRGVDPERAHGLALKALNIGFGPRSGPVTSDRLRCTIAGLQLPNPVGLAAGFDKNAESLKALGRTGFGFLEVGAATPLPQEGNSCPRLYRLTEDKAAINRFGFNNQGMVAIGERLAARPADSVVGLNLGANKTSDDRAADFASVLAHCGTNVDFATVNVSSPNTKNLRALQEKDALAALLGGVMAANVAGIPIFLKIAPDLSDADLSDVVQVARTTGVAGIIATNTTLSRDGLVSGHKSEAGGLSGQPLFERSTRVLAKISSLTDLPLIGVGGVGSGEQAYEKIRAGASAVQLYTALVYGGISLASNIARELHDLLARDGFSNVAEAIGTGRADWL